MNQPVKMFNKNRKEICLVYDIDFEKRQATVFSPAMLAKTNGGTCWETISLKHLIPEEYGCMFAEKGYMTKTKKNQYKEMLKLKSAIWEATDGTEFSDVEAAVEYQMHLSEDAAINEDDMKEGDMTNAG